MKRILLTLTALSCFLSASGAEKEQAQKVAEGFFRQLDTRSAPAAVRQVDDSGDGAYFIFEREGGGFVIVSACDAAHPVLGFSRTGRFDPASLPEGARELLAWTQEVLGAASRRKMRPSGAVAAEWQDLLQGRYRDGASEVVLETAAWSQRDPFNRLCPEIGGERCATGCVNTAAAIIMRYYKWPDAGTGKLAGYTAGGVTYEGHALGHPYDWDNMPLVYQDGAYTEEQANQVARLMVDLGTMSRANYGVGITTADSDAIAGLTYYFGYSDEMKSLSRSSWISDEKWEGIIKAEIDAGRPVYYSGYKPGQNGHAFVINGYSGRYFSINYGRSNASLFLLISPIDDYGYDLFEYNVSQSMWINIHPDGSSAPLPVQCRGDIDIAHDWAYTPETPFDVQWTAYLTNLGPEPFEGDFALGLADPDGTVVEVVTEPFRQRIGAGESYYRFTRYEAVLHTVVRAGQTIRPCCKEAAGGSWSVIPVHTFVDEGIFRMVGEEPVAAGCVLDYETSDQEMLTVRFPTHTRWSLSKDGVPVEVPRAQYGKQYLRLFRSDSRRTKYTLRLFNLEDSYSLDLVL